MVLQCLKLFIPKVSNEFLRQIRRAHTVLEILGFKYTSEDYKTLQMFYFFKVNYIIMLLKSVIPLKYFTSLLSSNMLLNI